MSAEQAGTRAARRAADLEQRRTDRTHAMSASRRAERRRRRRIRSTAFGIVVVAVLGAGIYLAAGDLIGQRGSASTADAIPVRLSMAGFTPADVRVPAGQTVAIELWTTDAAQHLSNGVHTMISDELGIYEELPAAGPTGESRRIFEITTPVTPGIFDIYCDTCCGGKDSPTMHGRLTVEA
jgi:cytochrome c oxidase subunit II